MAGRREIKAYVTADTTGIKKGMSDAEQATNKLHSALDRFGPVGSGIATILGKLGFNSVGAAAGVGVAAAAVGAAAKIAEDAINQYVTLGEAVRKFSAITGQSAEESTRQVFAFKELGLDTDTLAAGMFKLAKAAADAKDPLGKVGVEIAKNADGTTDLNGTLLNVVTAWQNTTDAAKQAAIVFAAFGKSGAAMIPVLETNAAELRRLESQVQLLYTQKDLDAIRKYKIAQAELKQSNDDLGLSIGRALLPAQTSLVQGMNENIYVAQHLDDKLRELGHGTIPNTRAAMVEADRELRANYRAALDARDAQSSLGQSMQQAAAAAQAETDAEAKLYDAMQSQVDAGFALRQAQLDLTKAIKDASDAKGQDAEANLRQEEAYRRVGVAAAEYAAQQLGPSATAADVLAAKNAAQIKSYQDLQKTLTPGSPLYVMLQNWINALAQVPHNVETTVRVRGISTAGGSAGVHGNLSFDSGGTVPGPPGSIQTVQARGGEEFMGYGANRRSGGDIHIHIDRGAYIDGPSIDRLANLIAQRSGIASGR